MINTNRIARGLLDWMQDSRPVVDRATLLPIGQYEDGSLTLAWPGFLKDAAEGAQRTLLDAARVPVPDAPTGTRWASNVDALNAASIAPMAGVAGRAAGAIPRGTVASGGSDVAARLSEQPTGFRAYHGSPHDFKRFDLSKIGTGEGAQAYGHGLYFAEAEDVARMYRDKLSKGRRGRMYEVKIKADPDRFLDWDKPFAEQSPAVQAAMMRAGFGPHYENFGGKTVWPTREAAEEAALRHAGRRNARPGAVLVERDGGYSFEIPSTPMKNVYAYALREPEVASALREAGIPGVRYLDAGSRGAGEGSRNYVVFDDRLIDILRKYANPDTAALPALAAALRNGAGETLDVLFGSKNARIYDPPARPQRPFEADYPSGARADEAGRLTHTIDGDPIVPGATVVGRRTAGGPDEALSPAQYDAIAEGLFGSLPHYVPAGALPRGHVGRYRNVAGPDGPERNVAVLGSLPSPVRERVLAHEIGHGIEDLASGRFGIPQDGIKRDLATVYDTLNNPNRSGAEAASWGKAARPQDFGYAGDDIPAEHMAEAIRAYLTDPNYLKTVAPKAAARIREWVNTNPRVNTVIQFNANRGEAALPALFDYAMPPGGLLAPPEEPPLPGLLAYFTKDRPEER